MKPTARQVALFKSAPREYANLSINPPVIAAYYIDERFHTTWVIRSKTKFQDFDGKNGLEFTISDYKFLLPQVEAVFSSELVDCFGEPGAAVDLILGQDFINVYSFLFYKRTNDVLQLSRSCINRTIWPEKLKSRLDLYTSSHFGKRKGGIAAYVNICTPFNIWRPYKPSYWDPREDIGLAAMILAMRIATQIPISETAPIIRLIVSDKYTSERYAPFLETKYENLETSKDFKNLKVLRVQHNVKLFLEYRKKYADRNNLDELSCVHVDVHGTAEFIRYAKDLARLGAEMSQLHFKNELPSQPIDGNYYHFDSHTDVFTISRTETNKTIKRILQTYQEYQNSPGEEKPTKPLKDSSKGRTSITTNAYLRDIPTHDKAPINMTPITNCPSRKKTPTKKLPTTSPIDLCPNNFDLEDKPDNPLFSSVFTILDRVKAGKLTSTEKDSVLNEVNYKLQEVMTKEEDKALQTINRQRRNCDIIMAGAYKHHGKSIEVVKKAARLQGYLMGFIDSKEMSGVAQNGTETPTQGVAHQASDDNVNLALTEDVAKSSAQSTTAPERATDIAMADANQGLGNQQLAMEKSRLDGKIPNNANIPNETTPSTQCRFVKPAKVGEILRAKVDDGSLKVNHILEDQDNKNSPEGLRSTIDIKTDNLSRDSDMKTKNEPAVEIPSEIKEPQNDRVTKKKQDVNQVQVDDYKPIPKPKPAPVIDLPVKHKLALRNRYSDIKAYSCSLPVIHPQKHITSVDSDIDISRSCIAEGISTPEFPTDGITVKQRAEMTNVSGGGVEESLERPIITLVQALEISPDLRETLSMLLYNKGAKVDIIFSTDGGLRCVPAA